MTARRLVLLFPGFEPMTAADHVRRFRREAARTAGATAMRREFEAVGEDALDVAASGDGWRTDTRLIVLGWSDLIDAYRTRPPPVRAARGVLALLDILLSGTAFRYFRANFRYGLFYLYPLLQMAVALLAGWAVFAWGSAAGVLRPLAALAGLLATAALLWLGVRRLHLALLLDDWAMAADLSRGRNEAAQARVAAFAALLPAQASAYPADEILLAVHSLGAAFAVPALARALAQDPPAPQPVLLTVGSSLLKTALHPAARHQRAAVAALVETHRVAWLDVQAVSDPISFYGVNPAATLGIRGGRQPVVRRISFRKLLSPDYYRRIRRDLFRLHRQFVYGTERPGQYAFHAILLGPEPFERHLEVRR